MLLTEQIQMSYMGRPGMKLSDKEETILAFSKRERRISDIKAAVCDFYDKPEKILFGKSRLRKLVEARQITAFLLRKHTRLSLEEISVCIGKKDHTNIIHALNHIKGLMEVYPELVKTINAIEKKIF